MPQDLFPTLSPEELDDAARRWARVLGGPSWCCPTCRMAYQTLDGLKYHTDDECVVHRIHDS